MVTYEEVAGVTTWFGLTVQKGPMSKNMFCCTMKKFTKLAGLTEHAVLFCSNNNLGQNTYLYLKIKGGGGDKEEKIDYNVNRPGMASEIIK